jgi:glutathione S-transferase
MCASLCNQVQYEDERISFAQWGALKASGGTPFGSLPIIMVPGRGVISQNIALSTFVAKRTGLYSTDPFDACRIDELMLVAEDLGLLVGPTFRMSDEAEKKKERERLSADVFPGLLSKIDQCLAKGGTSKENPFAVGSSLTIADLKLFATFYMYRPGNMDFMADIDYTLYPALGAVYEKQSNSQLVKDHFAAFERG